MKSQYGGMMGDLTSTLEDVVRQHGKVEVITFMFYVEPGTRDLDILRLGIDGYFSVKDLDQETMDMIESLPPGKRVKAITETFLQHESKLSYYISAEEIDEETGRAFDVNRGWMMRFMFVDIDYDATLFRDEIAEYLSKGLTELRIAHEIIETKEVIFNV